jgi:TetR/AcrR family transcriptional regulator, cholesterol catabolism regulator
MTDLQYKIAHKAKELFMRYGFKAVSVDDISKQAGISKKTLYENFTDKDDLVIQAMNLVDADMEHKEAAIRKSSSNAIEEAIGHMLSMEEYLGKMNPTCFVDLQKYYPTALDKFEEDKTRIVESIKDNIKRGIKEGNYRKGLDIDFCAWHRFQSIFYMLQHPEFSKNFNMVKAQTEMMQYFMYGISTIKGHELIEQYISKHKKKK